MYKSARQAVGYMLRFMERRRCPRSPIVDPNMLKGETPGEDYGADALTVLVLFCRFDGSRRALTKLYLRRVRFREIKSRRDRDIVARANRRFLEALCCRGLIEYQGDDHEPHRSCRLLKAGTCPRFDPEKTVDMR